MLTFTDMAVTGFIPSFLSEDDPRPAAEQINAHNVGAWQSFQGFKLITDEKAPYKYALQYTGDPLTHEISRATLRDETLVLFEHSWLAIIQPDGSFDVARLD